jgi:hypothetical protein
LSVAAGTTYSLANDLEGHMADVPALASGRQVRRRPRRCTRARAATSFIGTIHPQ